MDFSQTESASGKELTFQNQPIDPTEPEPFVQQDNVSRGKPGKRLMKRLVFRVLTLAVILSLGAIAIAYAQRVNNASDPPDQQVDNSAAVNQGQLQPPPAVVIPEKQPNPLRGSRYDFGSADSSPSNYASNNPGTTTLDQGAYPLPGNAQAAPANEQNERHTGSPPPDLFGVQSANDQRPYANQSQASNSGYSSQATDYQQNNYSQPAYSGGQSYAYSNNPSNSQQVQADRRDNTSYDQNSRMVHPSYENSDPGPATPSQFKSDPSSAPLTNYADRSPAPADYSTGPAIESETSGYNPNSNPNSNNSSGYGFSPRAQQLESSMGATIRDEGTGRPASDRKLDGQQAPQLSIQKVAPEEIQVGKPAVFRIEVKNTGPVTAQNVEIRDQIPEGTRLIKTEPEAQRGARGELVWKLDNLEPGGGASVEMQLEPTTEGEIGSVATVHFAASASARSRATKPELVLNVTHPKTVLIEDKMILSITVSNPGSGVASGVVVEEHVPKCLQHPAGAELEYEVGDLAPNESKTFELTLTARDPGRANNVLIARADAVKEVVKQMPVEVIAPQLKVEMLGRKKRYLERQATYEVAVSNPGTAPARNVRLMAELPRGLKFVSADKNAHFDPQTRTVHWAVAELPVGVEGKVQLTTIPIEMGQHMVRLRSTAEKALPVQEQEEISIDGIAAIRFEVRDVKDPIAVGGESIYEIRVLNQGSKEATQVRLEARVMPGLKIVEAEGPDSLRYQQPQEGYLVFEPLPRLSPKVDVTYRVRVQGRQPGDQRIRVQLTAAELQRPVIKEESTNVFSDQ